jgi:hypothetical protein
MLLLPLGCAKKDSSGSAPSPASDEDSGLIADAGPFGCRPGDTVACVCSDGGIGQQSCVDGGFRGACDHCEEQDTPTGTLCVPGRYVGAYFIPKYLPTPAGFCGLATIYGGGGIGGWSFTLGETNPGSEFADLVTAQSCLQLSTIGATRAAAEDAGFELPDGGLWTNAPASPDGAVPSDAGAASPPLSMALTGSVNCATGEFTGEVKGTYRSPSVCGLGTDSMQYFIKGPVKATFDPKTRSFVDGTVDLHEPPLPLASLGIGDQPGGSGVWHAALKQDAPPPPDAGDCLGGVHFQDFTY